MTDGSRLQLNRENTGNFDELPILDSVSFSNHFNSNSNYGLSLRMGLRSKICLEDCGQMISSLLNLDHL